MLPRAELPNKFIDPANRAPHAGGCVVGKRTGTVGRGERPIHCLAQMIAQVPEPVELGDWDYHVLVTGKRHALGVEPR
jgi:hypothetical protein